MTETWTTEDSEMATDQPVPSTTDQPVPSTTVSTEEFTAALGNKTTSHLIPRMQQHSTPLSWTMLLGITASVVGGVVVLALIGWKCAVKPIRGFYSVVKQNNIRLHQV